MVLKFSILSDDNDSFEREFELLDNQTLLDFHNMIQTELEYDKSQLASFFTADDDWERLEEYTLFDMGANHSTMEETNIDDILIDANQKLLYVFDYFNNRALYIEYLGETKERDDVEYPICTFAKGDPPKQVTFRRKGKKVSNDVVLSEDFDEIGLDIADVDDLFIETKSNIDGFDDDMMFDGDDMGDDYGDEPIDELFDGEE